MQITNNKVWIPFLFIFVLSKLLSGQFEPSYLIISSALNTSSVFWFIVPYLLGKDMELPSSVGLLKKGENDIARFFYFILGFTVYISTVVGVA